MTDLEKQTITERANFTLAELRRIVKIRKLFLICSFIVPSLILALQLISIFLFKCPDYISWGYVIIILFSGIFFAYISNYYINKFLIIRNNLHKLIINMSIDFRIECEMEILRIFKK